VLLISRKARVDRLPLVVATIAALLVRACIGETIICKRRLIIYRRPAGDTLTLCAFDCSNAKNHAINGTQCERRAGGRGATANSF
jgi:hypothetical protein